MGRASFPITMTPAAGAGSAAQVEYQPMKPGDFPLPAWFTPPPVRLTAVSLEACPHSDLSPQDLQFLRDHPEVWVHTEHYTLERQQRIIEGWRQLLAVQEGTAKCPATGRACGKVGHGPHGIHSGCVLLSYK